MKSASNNFNCFPGNQLPKLAHLVQFKCLSEELGAWAPWASWPPWLRYCFHRPLRQWN